MIIAAVERASSGRSSRKAVERARDILRQGQPLKAAEALDEARQLARKIEPSPVSDEEFHSLQVSIETLPEESVELAPL